MKTTLLKTATEDNLILQGLLYEPDKTTKKIIVHVHGMSGNFYENSFLDEMALDFTNNGWAFLSPNTRGHDLISDFAVSGKHNEYKRVGNTFEKFEECILDIQTWLNLTEASNYKEIILQGHSLGSAKVSYYLAKTQDPRITKLILLSPPDMVGLFEKENNHLQLVKEAQALVKKGKPREILRGLIWDWYYFSAATYLDFSTRGNPIDVFNTHSKVVPSILADIKVPVLAVYGSEDDAAILPLTESLEVIKSKAEKCPKFNTLIIPGAPHSYYDKEKELATAILDWIKL